jgi:hypothetical protein
MSLLSDLLNAEYGRVPDPVCRDILCNFEYLNEYLQTCTSMNVIIALIKYEKLHANRESYLQRLLGKYNFIARQRNATDLITWRLTYERSNSREILN